MNWYKTCIGILFLAVGLTGCSITTRVKKADKKFAIGEYYDAADRYKQVYSRISTKTQKPLKAHVAFNQGECYRILNNTRASSCYQNAIRYKYQDSIVYLRLAQVLQYQTKYKEADKNYLIYLEAHPTDYVAQAGHYACNQVSEWKKETSRYKISLAKELNAKRSSSFAPALIGNNTDALMFTSNRQEASSDKKMKLQRPSPVTGAQNFQLYSTRKNAAGKWEEIGLAEGLYSKSESENESGSEGDSTSTKQVGKPELGVCCFTEDGKTMYFTYSCPVNGQDLGAKIYISSRASGEWGEPQELILFKDSSITVGHPSICPTEDTLYFVSDAPGGYGGKDIYMAIKEGNDWSDIRNLGPTINTTDDELYPCIHPNGTLYFASKGHPGYGGLDIFKAERDTLNKPTETEPIRWTLFNMGQPFNSSGDDFGITFEGESQNGFFSSNRGQKKGYDQIYRFDLPQMEFFVTGNVVDNNGEPISDAALRLVGDDGTNSKLQVRRDGSYKLKLNRDVNYLMLGYARGYLNQKEQFSTFDLTDSKTYEQDFVLNPISRPITMDNIFFEFGKWDLTPASESGLQQLVKLLQDNPNITIELSAHTDMVGDSLSNIELSQKRAQSVVTYLTKQGIDKERLTPVGYGKNKPFVADKATHTKYAFIPVEQELTEAFIMALPKDKQEICNSLNRRTEFKVLKTTYKLY
ncbi:MAG: OmpA family protein [Paludibacteraceae bacterium]|nr:OmpA family protein [Paludibacteraceae bacterium]